MCVCVRESNEQRIIQLLQSLSAPVKKGCVALKGSHRCDQQLQEMICSENEDDLHWMFHFNFLAVNIFHCSVQMRVMRFQREQMRSLLRVRSVVERGPETDVEEEKQ